MVKDTWSTKMDHIIRVNFKIIKDKVKEIMKILMDMITVESFLTIITMEKESWNFETSQFMKEILRKDICTAMDY